MEPFIRNFVARDGRWYSRDNFLKQRPGTAYDYSNLGSAIAGLIVERVTGETYAEYTRKNILIPLGMADSGWSFETIDLSRFVTMYVLDMKAFPKYSKIGYPAGGLITSLDDMTRYAMELLRGFQGEGSLLRQESFREMVRPQSRVHLGGIFWSLQDACDDQVNCFGHGGGDYGTISSIGFDAKANLGVMLFTNYNTQNNFSEDVPAARAFSAARQALTDYARQAGNAN
jgi:CubicO group peptidase (beta-lactamase class C family)